MEKVENNLTPNNLEKARGELSTLLNSKEKFEKEIGPENVENFKKQMDGLKGISDSISQKAMKNFQTLNLQVLVVTTRIYSKKAMMKITYV